MNILVDGWIDEWMYRDVSIHVTYLDNSPPGQFPTLQVLGLVNGFTCLWWSWWGVVLGKVVVVGNSWALFLLGGELSPVGSCPRTVSVD